LGIPTTHDLVYGSYSLPCTPDPTDLPNFFRDYKNINMDALLDDVSNLDWSEVFAATDANIELHIFDTYILSIFEHYVRLKRFIPRNMVNP
jgi:hypothetical protein